MRFVLIRAEPELEKKLKRMLAAQTTNGWELAAKIRF